MAASEDNKQVDLTEAAAQETPRSETADARPPTDTPDTPEQAEPKASPTPVDTPTQPILPPTQGRSVKTRILPERQMPELPSPTEPSEAPPSLADLSWMPRAEDQVARFLNDVADMAPPPVREREGARPPGFMLPSVTSPEAVQRKKAKTEPFWSQVVATPMEQRASSPAAATPRRSGRKRSRRSRLWLVVVVIILLLVIVSAAVVAMRLGLVHSPIHL